MPSIEETAAGACPVGEATSGDENWKEKIGSGRIFDECQRQAATTRKGCQLRPFALSAASSNCHIVNAIIVVAYFPEPGEPTGEPLEEPQGGPLEQPLEQPLGELPREPSFLPLSRV